MSSNALAMALKYKKFSSGQRPKVLILKSNYLLINDCIEAAEYLDWEIHTLPTPQEGTASQDFLATLLRMLVHAKPDFILNINQSGFDAGGNLAELLNRFEIPVASWFVDHPLPILAGSHKNAQDNTQVFTFERTSMDWLQSIGFKDVEYLPTAASPCMARHNRDTSKFSHSIAFVGGSWWERARNTFPEEVQSKASKLLEREEKAIQDHLRPNGPDVPIELARVVQAALAELSLQKRQQLIESLSALSPVVYGDHHWSELVSDVNLLQPVDFTSELPSLFVSTKINLNITAAQMPTAVNQRVWDVPLAGGFLLTDDQDDGLAHFKEDESIVVYRSYDEACDKAAYYLRNDSKRVNIIKQANALVQEKHQLHHRLQSIKSTMKKRFS